MAHSFQDRGGNTWRIEFDDDAVFRLRLTNPGRTIKDFFPAGDEPVDHVAVLAGVWTFCQVQAAIEGVSCEAWIRRMDAKALMEARRAIFAAMKERAEELPTPAEGTKA